MYGPHMEPTSGGTGGPCPNPALDELGLRVYTTLPAGPRPDALARAFHAMGWSVRKSSADEYEVSHTWAELTLFLQDGMSMLSGRVLPAHFDDLLRSLDLLAIPYRGEIYEGSGALLRTFTSAD